MTDRVEIPPQVAELLELPAEPVFLDELDTDRVVLLDALGSLAHYHPNEVESQAEGDAGVFEEFTEDELRKRGFDWDAYVDQNMILRASPRDLVDNARAALSK